MYLWSDSLREGLKIVKLCLAEFCAYSAEHQQDLSEFSDRAKVSLRGCASSCMILLAEIRIF